MEIISRFQQSPNLCKRPADELRSLGIAPVADLPVGQALMEHPGAESEPHQALVEIAGRPVGEAGVDRLGEGEEALGDPAGGSDDDHHQDLRSEMILTLEKLGIEVIDEARLRELLGD